MKVRRAGGWSDLLRYTLLFAVCAFVFWLSLTLQGKLMVMATDGYLQLYPTLGYIGQVLRRLLAGQGFRMVDFHLGQGMDVLTILSYYGLTDPLNLLAVFFSEYQTLHAYTLIAFLRAWLTGLAFMAYAARVGARRGWTMVWSAIILVFSGFFVFNLARHPYFLNGPLCLLLVLHGVEGVLRGDGKGPGYALAVACMLVLNYYLAFMSTVVTILYIVVRLAARWPERRVRGTARDGFTLLGGYLLGTAVSAVVFLPVVRAFLENIRLGNVTGYDRSMLFYPPAYYGKLYQSLFSAGALPVSWTVLNFAPLALAGILLLFVAGGRKAWQLKLALVLCLCALCVPWVGLMMNGRAYVANRWCYALGVFAALSCALSLPDLWTVDGKRRWLVGGLMLAYSATLLAMYPIGLEHLPLELAVALLLAVFALAYGTGWLSRQPAPRANGLVTAFLIAAVAMQIVTMNVRESRLEGLADVGIVERYRNETVADRLEGDEPGRIDQLWFRDAHAITKEYMGTSYYWSLVNGCMADYYLKLGLPSQVYLVAIQDLGGSCELTGAAAVRCYLLREPQKQAVVPYGFRPMEPVTSEDGTLFYPYENTDALPLGYAFDRTISNADFDALNVERRIQTLLSRAICDVQGMPTAPAPDDGIEVPWSWGDLKDARCEDNLLQIQAGGSVRLDFSTPEDVETWLIIDRLESSEETYLNVESEAGMNYAKVINRGSNAYFERPVTAICLGCGAIGDGCTLTPQDDITCRFGEIRVVCLPMSAHRENVAARGAEALRDVQLDNNRLRGTIDVAGRRVLQIAVPYSSGWTATVDGAPAEVFRCGGMYMGILLEEGAHSVEMRYVTPGLRTGAMISLAGWIVLLSWALCSRRRRKVASADRQRNRRAVESSPSD